MPKCLAVAAALLLLALPAAAHQGQHGHMTTVDLLAHFAEPNHVALLIVALVIFAGLVWRKAWRSAGEARQRARRQEDHRQ